MSTYKTPDVYIEEVSVFPPSVAEVETAIPVFIGYTERAEQPGVGDRRGRPTKIYSFTEFEQIFGRPKEDDIVVDVSAEPAANPVTVVGAVKVTEPDVSYLLAYAVKAYFDNGGGKCYIVSVGGYADNIDKADLEGGLAQVAMEDEPTLLVIPEAADLSLADYTSVCQAMLRQCGKLMDRFAILDVRGGNRVFSDATITEARTAFGTSDLKYGAAYYPYVRTTMNFHVSEDEQNVKVRINGGAAESLDTLRSTSTAIYNAVKAALQNSYVVLPPSALIAGVYASTDNRRGVWKAPANVSLSNVIGPVVPIDNDHQDGLNVDPTTGKSINAIRAFTGKGTLVWGARTLAGNDNEWRYVSVRRFFNMVEESVKKSTYWAVFEPNDANTWVKVRGMIENYLTQKWREGALAGSTTRDAFAVFCGLGTTMTPQDILEGRMNVEIRMAVVRPAEFVILKFSHKLQTS